MAQTFEYWRPTTGQYHPALPGIEVLTNDTNWMGGYAGPFPAGFRAEVDDALTWINNTPTGAMVLTELHNNGFSTVVSPSRYGNLIQMNSTDSLNRVAYELVMGSGPGAATRNAAIAVFGGPLGSLHAAAHGLAAAINSTPRWTLTAMPGLGAWGTRLQKVRNYVNQWALLIDPRYFRWSDSNEGYWTDQTWVRNLGVTGFDVGLTAPQAYTWLTTAALPNTLTTVERDHVILSTIASLDSQAQAGAGCDCVVQWCIDPANALNRVRPPAIGLGHELIHSYFGVRGEQPGVEAPNNLSVELFEYRCVGLGPWDEAMPSENSLRREWWTNTSHLIPSHDTLNRKVPPKRVQYD